MVFLSLHKDEERFPGELLESGLFQTVELYWYCADGGSRSVLTNLQAIKPPPPSRLRG